MFFLELSCFFSDPADVGNLISGSSAFSKTNLNIRKFTVHVLLKPGLENLGVASVEHDLVTKPPPSVHVNTAAAKSLQLCPTLCDPM